MKRFFALLLCVCALTVWAAALADTDFDPSRYTEDELYEIMASISLHLRNAEAGEVIYDRNGVVIEFRGIAYDRSFNNYYFDVMVRNDTDSDLTLSLNSVYLDRAKVGLANSSGSIRANSLWISSLGSKNLKFSVADLAGYGITRATNLDASFTLTSSDRSIKDSFELHLPVDLVP